jgi:hypothetical protein
MATVKERLALSLQELQKLQNPNGITILQSQDLTRTHLERLVKNGFLQEIIRGWYMASRPDVPVGDTTAWNASCWHFIAKYANSRFGREWCLSPEQSLSFYSGDYLIPAQISIRTNNNSTAITKLPQDRSLLYYQAKLADPVVMDERYGLRIYSLAEALVECSANYYQNNNINARTCLLLVYDISDILKLLFGAGQTTKAGRLAGAFRAVGNNRAADEILRTFKEFAYDIRETNPFAAEEYQLQPISIAQGSPYAARLRLLWEEMRPIIAEELPIENGLPQNAADCIAYIERQYKSDAYHSLSIEGFQVSDELIQKVQSGVWNPNNNDNDYELKNALAAKGYWLAYNSVVKSIQTILKGDAAAHVVHTDIDSWYRALFTPSVSAGILSQSDIIGYRNTQVYIQGSCHTPLSPAAVRNAMPVLFDLLESEPHAAVRAILGHFLFVYIHPYIDGNGRIARFLMNTQLISGGYPWVIIPLEQRATYMSALEKASVGGDISEFSGFINSLIRNSKNTTY